MNKSVVLPSSVNQISVQRADIDNNLQLGILTHGSHFSFQYTQPDIPVSLSMKIRDDSYNHGVIHPIFSQNLPEGFTRRYIADKLARFGKIDDMYFLALQGTNGIGALSYDAGIQLPEVEQISLKEILSWSSAKELFPQLLERYYLRGILSGIQPKVMISTSETERAIVQQKDIIVKTCDEEFPLLTVNEFVCMEAARACLLEPPVTYLSDNLEHFIIERFDSVDNKRLAFEDFSTLMNKPGDEKYNSSYETLLKAVRVYTGSIEEVTKAYKIVVFSCIIGNGDAHLKNFALQYSLGKQDIILSPPYDITHTIIYETIDNDMALRIKKSKAFPNKQELIRLGAEAGVLNSDQIVEFISDHASDFIKSSEEIKLMKGLKESIEHSISIASISAPPIKQYRHNKKRKYD
ncbi:MAG: type II toxin-antitoxin system HipA family toxin [Gammaproteobacteria bacterium]|nr:type II toxin-antitoxin system HipA family toxin [Gammaproteobacteria bacterium]